MELLLLRGASAKAYDLQKDMRSRQARVALELQEPCSELAEARRHTLKVISVEANRNSAFKREGARNGHAKQRQPSTI
jgi:hypothetical protein